MGEDVNYNERIDGDKKYIMFYMDDNGKSVDEEHATKFIARVEDLNGNLLKESFGFVNSNIREEGLNNDDEILYVSQQKYEYLKRIDEENNYGMDFSKIKIR